MAQFVSQKKHHTLIEQLNHFPKGAHDDGPDALEMAFRACQEYANDSDWFEIDTDPDDF